MFFQLVCFGTSIFCGENAFSQSTGKKTLADVEVYPVIAFPNLQFRKPVDFQSPRDGTNRIFVVEQKGRIFVFENDRDVKEKKVFLDIQREVFTRHKEEGLLGLAFHPAYRENGKFYVYYSANRPRRSVVAEYCVSPSDPDKADMGSKKILMEVKQPFGNHNGGQICFGPDGYLYISLGDGGAAGDPFGHGQNRKTVLASLLRIDVDHTEGEKKYAIPADNPYKGNKKGFREEIFAYGLRNVWRFSFDAETGWIWGGDVGQNKPIEEINVIEKGKNYGWNLMEGNEKFKVPRGMNLGKLEKPIWTYSRDKGRSITGGFVYRGKENPPLYGKYIYADYASGRVWALSFSGKKAVANKLLYKNLRIEVASFGVDAQKELYLCSFDGRIYKLKTK